MHVLNALRMHEKPAQYLREKLISQTNQPSTVRPINYNTELDFASPVCGLQPLKWFEFAAQSVPNY
jgi:hypothetical protein